MRKVKQTAVSVLLLLCFGLMAVPTYAADDRLGTVVGGSLLTDEQEATVTVYPKARGSLLSYGTGSVSIVGKRQVKLGGSTAAYLNVDQIQVKMYLQKLVGSNWAPVLSLGPAIKYNSNYVSTANTYSVTGGYYYRAYGHHAAIENGTTEAMPSYSDGVWVS